MTDLFCGAGGSSTGAIQVPGVSIRVASNHWQLAVDTHNTNHQDADHVCADLTQIDPRYFPTTDILWASPECTNHSIARGRKRAQDGMGPDLFGEGLPDEAAQRSRATMWDVPRFTEVHQYQAVIVENVVDAANWVPFKAWLLAMDSLGYEHQIVYLNSMHAWHLGAAAPQSRDRLYVVFWRKGNQKPDLEHMQRPPAWCPMHGEVRAMQAFKNPSKRWGRYRAQYVYRCPRVECRNQILEPAWVPAASIIDWSDTGTRIGDRTRPLAEKTMKRIQAGIDRYWGQAVEPLMVNNVSGADASRSTTTRDVAPTMVAGGTHASLLVPVEGRNGKEAVPVGLPYRTQTTRNETGVAFAPLMTPAGGTWNEDARPASDPWRTRTTRETEGITFAPFIAELRGGGSDARPVDDPLATVTASGNHHALVTSYYGKGGSTTSDQALPTVTTMEKHALIMRNNNGGAEMSTPVSEPVRTVTTKGHQSLLTQGQSVAIEDCHFRMLTPNEIQQAMAFPAEYMLLGNKREKVRMAGNAVTPPAARDLVGAVTQTLA